MNWLVVICWIIITTWAAIAARIESRDKAITQGGEEEVYVRTKRWSRYGNKVWREPVKIGFKNYTEIYSREEQEAVLKECTEMWTIPGYLEFIIIKPSTQRRAHITISNQKINELLNGGQWRTMGYAYSPQPQDPLGTRIVLGSYSPRLRLRKYYDYGASYKLILCHEIGHALGISDSDDRSTIMYFSATWSMAPDHILDWDSALGIKWLYRTRYTARSMTTTPRQTTPRNTAPRIYITPRYTTPRNTTPRIYITPRNTTPRVNKSPRNTTPKRAFIAPRSTTPRIIMVPRITTPRIFIAPRSATPRNTTPRPTTPRNITRRFTTQRTTTEASSERSEGIRRPLNNQGSINNRTKKEKKSRSQKNPISSRNASRAFTRSSQSRESRRNNRRQGKRKQGAVRSRPEKVRVTAMTPAATARPSQDPPQEQTQPARRCGMSRGRWVCRSLRKR